MNKIEPKELDAALTDTLTIVFISAEWCGPCKGVYPKIKKLVETFPDVPHFYINIEDRGESLSVPLLLGAIQGFPSYLIFKNREIKAKGHPAGLDILNYFRDYEKMDKKYE